MQRFGIDMDTVDFEITDDRIAVFFSGKKVFEEERYYCRKLLKKTMLENYSALMHMVKVREIKVVYSYHYRDFIIENWSQYSKEINEYDKNYEALEELMRKVCLSESYSEKEVEKMHEYIDKLRELKGLNNVGLICKMYDINTELLNTYKQLSAYSYIKEIYL